MKAGELRAIIGPNGAGKTTMMDVVTGKTKPDAGEVFFNGGIDLTKLDEARIANLGIGRKFQKPTVFENHTVLDNLELAAAGNRGVFPALAFRRFRRAARPHRRGAAHRLARRGSATGWPARCRTGKSNGWRSACC